jgi:pyruvate kinase
VARRTKIVATIGPASADRRVLRSMVDAGMDVARLGLAHGALEEHLERLACVRRVAADAGRTVAVLADLPGPKTRAAPFPDGGVFLVEGAAVDLVPSRPSDPSHAGRTGASDESVVAVDRPDLLDELEAGDVVVLGDGAVELRVDGVDRSRATARVVSGGRVLGRPGVTLLPERRCAAAPTPEDLRLLDAMAVAGADHVAVSFVRAAADVAAAREASGPDGPQVVAKIETPEALDDLDAILGVADGVMVARGDLGIRVPLEEVPHHQKRVIRTCVAWGRPVVTATQMLESMVHAPTPTRAEVSDVANAVFDGTDALMLSAETAIGHDPAEAVRTMARIAERAEAEADYVAWGGRLGRLQRSASVPATGPLVTGAMTAAAWRAVLDVDAAALICCTRSGSTARAMARFRPTVPLLAVTPLDATARQLALTWGVVPLVVGERSSTDDIVWFAVEETVRRGHASAGDVVAVLAGSPDDPEPATDVLRLVRVR